MADAWAGPLTIPSPCASICHLRKSAPFASPKLTKASAKCLSGSHHPASLCKHLRKIPKLTKASAKCLSGSHHSASLCKHLPLAKNSPLHKPTDESKCQMLERVSPLHLPAQAFATCQDQPLAQPQERSCKCLSGVTIPPPCASIWHSPRPALFANLDSREQVSRFPVQAFATRNLQKARANPFATVGITAIPCDLSHGALPNRGDDCAPTNTNP